MTIQIEDLVRVNGNVIDLPFQIYATSGVAFPAFMAAGHIEGIAKSLTQTKHLLQKLIPDVDFGENLVLLDTVRPGGSKFWDWTFRLTLGSDEEANATADKIREWLKMHPVALGVISVAVILSVGGIYLANRYIDASQQGDVIQHSKNILKDVSLELNMDGPVFIELAQASCPPSTTLMKTAATILSPVKETGGALKIGGKEEGINIPKEMIQKIPSPDQIVDDEDLIPVPFTAISACVVQSSMEHTDQIWKLKLPDENPFSKRSIKTILDVEQGVTPAQLMWKQHVVVDLIIYCKSKKASLTAKHLVVTKVYTEEEIKALNQETEEINDSI